MKIEVAVILSFCLAGCAGARLQTAPAQASVPATGSAGTRLGIPAVSGRVELADLGLLPVGGRAVRVTAGGALSVQATLVEVGVGATVSLIDTGTGNTATTTLTDASGVFVMSFDPGFVPAEGATYFMEAVKGLGNHAVGSNAARVRTIIRWSGGAWQSITGASVTIGTSTTALGAIFGLKAGLVSAASLIGTVSGTTYDGSAANCSVAEFDQAQAVIQQELAADQDPLAGIARDATTGTFYRRFTSVGLLALDDLGDPTQTHDYQVTKSGVTSTFVWIPTFTAYQLIVPGSCGAIGDGKPVGYWVATRPTSGTEAPAGTANGDFAMERFGGFYAGKFEASRSDANPGDPATGSGATAGSGTTLKVAQYCVPWTDMDWDSAANTCLSYDAHCHLMRDDEWTALAVWATMNNLPVHGNNNGRKDIDDASITFVDDPTFGGSDDRSLTGTGTRGTWSGGTNLTTHAGTTGGVYDLNGNVYEWTGTVGAAITTGYYVVDDITVPVSVGTGYISALSTDPRLRRLGLPGATGTSTALLGGDDLWRNTSIPVKSIRGGNWPDGGTAGIWALNHYRARTNTFDHVGFRPAVRYN